MSQGKYIEGSAAVIDVLKVAWNVIVYFFVRRKVDVRILSIRFDDKDFRWVFRLSVLNKLDHMAIGCRGYWSILDSQYHQIMSGASAYWTPEEDDDYDFMDKSRLSRDIACEERAHSWVELNLVQQPVKPTGKYLFPYSARAGRYYLVVVIQYGAKKDFAFCGLELKSSVHPTDDAQFVNQQIKFLWPANDIYLPTWHHFRLWRAISRTDYYEELRPT